MESSQHPLTSWSIIRKSGSLQKEIRTNPLCDRKCNEQRELSGVELSVLLHTYCPRQLRCCCYKSVTVPGQQYLSLAESNTNPLLSNSAVAVWQKGIPTSGSPVNFLFSDKVLEQSFPARSSPSPPLLHKHSSQEISGSLLILILQILS